MNKVEFKLRKLIREEIRTILGEEAKKTFTGTAKFGEIYDWDGDDEENIDTALIRLDNDNKVIKWFDEWLPSGDAIFLSNTTNLESKLKSLLKAKKVEDVYDDYYGMGEEGEYEYYKVYSPKLSLSEMEKILSKTKFPVKFKVE